MIKSLMVCLAMIAQPSYSLSSEVPPAKVNEVAAQPAYSLSFEAPPVKVNEFVVDPWGDYNQNGPINDSDQYFELFNTSYTNSYSLNGWKLELDDTTPAVFNIGNVVIEPRGFYVIINPPGDQNHNGEIRLRDNFGNLVDKVNYGNWKGQIGFPDGDASSLLNESVSRFPDGENNWGKTIATPGRANLPLVESWARLFVSRKDNGVFIHAEGLENKIWTLEESFDLKNWSGVHTNDFYGNLFSFTENNPNKGKAFYRIIGRD